MQDHRITIPQSGLLSQASSLRLPSGHSGPLLPVPPLLASGGCERLGCCTSGSCCWPHNLWVLIIYLFFLPVILPFEIPRLVTDLPERVFPGFWKPLFFKNPFPGHISIPTSCPSFYLLYFVLPPFKHNGLPSGCLMSSAIIQKLFCGICSGFKCSFDEFVGEKVVFLPIPPPS